MAENSAKIHALLIGINGYLKNRMPENFYYRNLQGCVKDILDTERFLRKRLNVEHVIRLTSSVKGNNKDLLTCSPDDIEESPEQWPTYHNIVQAFRTLEEQAQPGDQVYIHYSGHGGRTKTMPQFLEFKGGNALDETLVPSDIGNPEGQPLRDIEIAYLLQKLVAKKLYVTVVLDSCFSGGATRNVSGAMVRGIGDSIPVKQTGESLVAPPEELREIFRRASSQNEGKPGFKHKWFLEASGYTLIAACRLVEQAHEWPYEAPQLNGALTHFWLEALNTLGHTPTYQMVFNRVCANIHTQFNNQTPELQGEGDRVIFSDREIKHPAAVNVIRVGEHNQILLAAGKPQGVNKGAQFALYPPGTIDFGDKANCVAIVEVEQSDIEESKARVVERLQPTTLTEGAQALLINPGRHDLMLEVKLLPPAFDNAHAKALDELRELLTQSKFVRLVSETERSRLNVSVVPEGEFVVSDTGGRPIQNLRPKLSANDPESAGRLFKRLEHLAKFHIVEGLSNRHPASPLAGKLLLKLERLQSDYDEAAPYITRPLDEFEGLKTIAAGEWALLTIRNESAQTLNITVLNIRPDWAITQLYPAGAAHFEPLEREQERQLPLCANLPNGYVEGEDILKVFATVSSNNFRWLELPPLDEPFLPKSYSRDPKNILDNYLALLLEEGASKRTFDLAPHVGSYWTTEEILVRMAKHPDLCTL